jgi:hypothetical protein
MTALSFVVATTLFMAIGILVWIGVDLWGFPPQMYPEAVPTLLEDIRSATIADGVYLILVWVVMRRPWFWPAEVFLKRGRRFLEAGEFEQAVEAFTIAHDKAASGTSEAEVAAYWLNRALAQRGEPPEARSSLSEGRPDALPRSSIKIFIPWVALAFVSLLPSELLGGLLEVAAVQGGDQGAVVGEALGMGAHLWAMATALGTRENQGGGGSSWRRRVASDPDRRRSAHQGPGDCPCPGAVRAIG